MQTAEARQVLVDSYVALRRGDTAPGGKVAYRMTVRQLEALIRLSEAIARCHLDDEVSTRHVRLTTRLLKTSVISVESTEIDLTEFQDENQEDGDVGENGEAEPSGAHADPTTEHPDGPGGKKLVITDEYFQRVTQALVMRLRQHEETVTREGSGLAGMRQRDLIQWYVAQQNEKNNYSSAEEAKAEIIKLKAIIESLVRREGHLIVVDEEEATAQGDDDGNTRRSSRNNKILAVAPNYVID